MQSEELLNEMLGRAKDNPFKVRLEFDHRFRVWKKIIHRNRRLHLIAASTPEELRSLHGRYKALDIADAERLQRRAFTEFDYVTIGSENVFAALGHYQILKYRSREIEQQLSYQLSQYERIVDERIRQRTTVIEPQYIQLKEA